MNAYIYLGGECFPELLGQEVQPGKDDLTIAADSGYHIARALGVTPSVLVGDFDSYGDEPFPDSAERLQVPAEKDFTDAQLAVETARRRGADSIVIIGGLGGRLDHTLSCLSLLEDLWHCGIHRAVIQNGKNRARYLEADSTLLPASDYRYLSLIAVDPVVKGVEIRGVKYPLERATLKRGWQYAVSNEITGNCAFLSVRKGGLFVIESRD